MWEITIVGKQEDIGYLELLKAEINETFGREVLVAISCNNGYYCSIATSNRSFVHNLKYIIVSTILKIAKNEYYLENLRILGEDKDLNKFILISLIHIGLEEETHYVISHSKIPKEIHIRSFVKFKLSKLESVWATTIIYIYKRLSGVESSLVYLEFLRFLVLNSEPKNEVVFLINSDQSVQLLDNENKILSDMPKSDEIGVVVNLILQAPKKLIINCFDSLSKKVADLIMYIFDDRICMIL